MINVAPSDVLSRWIGGDAPSQTDNTLTTFIEDAMLLVRMEYKDIDARALTEPNLTALTKKVVSEAVIRAWKVGYEYRSSFSEGVSSFNHAASYSFEDGRRGVYFTDDELSLLAPVVEAEGGVYTASLYGNYHPYYSTYEELRPL